MSDKGRFTGRQVTVIVVAIAIAATGTSVRLIGTNPHHTAAVSSTGSLSVSPGQPTGAFSSALNGGNKLIKKAPCGTKFAITTFSDTSDGSRDDVGLNLVVVGTKANGGVGDQLSVQVPADDTRSLSYVQPFILKPAALAKGNTCEYIDLYEDGGIDGEVSVVGYQIP
jgi:hypothetical protein